MAKLNVNFHQSTDRYEPTKSEITDIEALAFSVTAIIKTLWAYACVNDKENGDVSDVCMCVCNALELLMEPITGYMTEYAGDIATPEKEPAP
ncbi:MAG: hypothetical protein LBH07_05115 [Treponema sp.]|jgi:hypothetical protein|nr:hypothetical protein [Treponema sp.]